jgi:hypothetical protein
MDLIGNLGPGYLAAIKLIDEAHAQDPNTTEGPNGPMPYELHYAQKMTRWLTSRCPDASPTLQLACRAQHFRRFVSLSTVSPLPGNAAKQLDSYGMLTDIF